MPLEIFLLLFLLQTRWTWTPRSRGWQRSDTYASLHCVRARRMYIYIYIFIYIYIYNIDGARTRSTNYICNKYVYVLRGWDRRRTRPLATKPGWQLTDCAHRMRLGRRLLCRRLGPNVVWLRCAEKADWTGLPRARARARVCRVCCMSGNVGRGARGRGQVYAWFMVGLCVAVAVVPPVPSCPPPTARQLLAPPHHCRCDRLPTSPDALLRQTVRSPTPLCVPTVGGTDRSPPLRPSLPLMVSSRRGMHPRRRFVRTSAAIRLRRARDHDASAAWVILGLCII